MGASVSICNLTNLIIHVALKQATPLHYHNYLTPNQCTTFTVGRVWFTIEAKMASMEPPNEYSMLGETIEPITSLATRTFQTSLKVTDLEGVNNALKDLVDGTENLVKEDRKNRDNSPKKLTARLSSQYMTSGKRYQVVGGPISAPVIDPQTGNQKVNFSENFPALMIRQSK